MSLLLIIIDGLVLEVYVRSSSVFIHVDPREQQHFESFRSVPIHEVIVVFWYLFIYSICFAVCEKDEDV